VPPPPKKKLAKLAPPIEGGGEDFCKA
jgi:hypothetical protein